MTTSKENKSPSKFKKRSVIAACLLLSAIVAVIYIKRYQTIHTTGPQQISPSIGSTAPTGTIPTESSESPYTEEPNESRKHQLQESDRQVLIEKGLKDPIHDLVQDLMKHNELIPCEGTVGGTPGFYNPDRIAVLNKDHVIADYDDGHVEGTVELTFTVSNGAISWMVVNAECGD